MKTNNEGCISHEPEKWVVTYATTIQGRPVAFGVAFNGTTFNSKKEAWEHCKFACKLKLKEYDTDSCLIEDERIDSNESYAGFQVSDKLLHCYQAFSVQQILNN